MLPFVIRTGSCVLMKAKEGAKGTFLSSTGKYVWNIKGDDGKICADYKSQQLDVRRNQEHQQMQHHQHRSPFLKVSVLVFFCRWLLLINSVLMLLFSSCRS